MNKEKLKESILGFAIGDALGVPFEFCQRDSFHCSDMTEYGSHDQPLGTWSDDTSMTIATQDSLKHMNGKIACNDIRNNFLKWFNYGEYTANGECFDIGHTTLKALLSKTSLNGINNNGNGSLMRILPLAFIDCSDEEIRNVSAITHGNDISTVSCIIYVHIAKRLLNGEKITDIIPTLIYEKPFDRLKFINSLNRDSINSTGYVVDTLEAVLWALSHDEAHNSSFSSVVLDAINLGNDTDTIGALTGGLAAIIYGLNEPIAQKWLSLLRNKESILNVLY